MAYDPRAVNLPKSIKTMAAFIQDKSQRREFIRGAVKLEEARAEYRSSRNKKDKK